MASDRNSYINQEHSQECALHLLTEEEAKQKDYGCTCYYVLQLKPEIKIFRTASMDVITRDNVIFLGKGLSDADVLAVLKAGMVVSEHPDIGQRIYSGRISTAK
jgi:hypothetical protein